MDYYAALKSEITADPAALGYAGKSRGQVLALLNQPADQFNPARTWTKQNQYIPVNVLLYWGAKTGVRAKVEAAAANSVSPVQGLALAIKDLLLSSSANPGLNTLDPAVAGAIAGGLPYVPNSGVTVVTPGMIDDLVAGSVFPANASAPGGVPTPGSKDDLLLLAVVPATRAENLWGAGWLVSLADLEHVM